MSRQAEKLYDGITHLSDETVEQAQKTVFRRKSWRRWTGPVAAVLVLAILGGLIFGRDPLRAYAIEEPVYPEERVRLNYENYLAKMGGSLDHFLNATIPEFLGGAGEQNRVYSPLNVYLALSMLCELTGGSTRAQMLELLGSRSISQQRERAKLLWQQQYFDRKEGKCVLANSVWLDDRVPFKAGTMKTLAEDYYASSYSGPMEKLGGALRDWLNTQTGGLLKEQTGSLNLPADTVLALASTVYFRGKWQSEFQKSGTAPRTFHAPAGDQTAEFLHKNKMSGFYYWGERFGAVNQNFTNGCSMWYFLPDEGVTPEDLLNDPECMSLLTADIIRRSEWEQSKYLFINLAVPKFDVASDLDLLDGLRRLGLGEALDPMTADFTPTTADGADAYELYLSQASHAARVMIDEEGCTAVSYVVFTMAAGAAAPPDDEIDFTLDRPFLFAVTGLDGLPLFVGVVNTVE